MDMPFPPIPELSDSIAYISGAVSIVLGLLLLGWGRLWSRPTVGVIGVGAGFLCGGLLADGMKVDSGVAKAAVGSILGVLGFVAAPFMWAFLAGSLCSLVAGGFMAESFLAEVGFKVDAPPGGFTPESWMEMLSVCSRDVSFDMWQQQATTMVLVMAPAGLIPTMIGLWKPRFITIVMTSLTGAIMVVGGSSLALVQSDPTHWPTEWPRLLIPLCIIGGLWVAGMAVQCSFAMAGARKKKAKEVARAQADLNK
ncbi:MAG: hypothetical protein QGH60_14610 [Phycisphaerae bacterium]|jgi:hypothetical protein|nr:hypothetical protein [Phycisphaerae bacterium]